MSQPSARGKMNGATKSKPALLVGLVAVLALLAGSRSFAQGNVADTAAVTEVMQTLEADQLQVAQPAGLAYSGADDTFVLLDASTAAAYTLYDPTTNEAVALAGGPAVDVGANMTFDGARLLLLDGRSGELTAAAVAADQAALVVSGSYSLAALNLQQPWGMAVDGATGDLYILDSGTNRVAHIVPGDNGDFDGAAALAAGRVGFVDLSSLGAGGLRGLAFNPATGHLYALEPARLLLYEFTTTGERVKTHDLHGSGLVNPQALVFALSGDQTDDPSRYDIYIADDGAPLAAPANPDVWSMATRLYLPQVAGSQLAGSQLAGSQLAAADAAAANGADAAAATARPGKVVEIGLDQPLRVQAAVVNTPLTLVRTTQTWQWSPSSPDPDGVVYVPSANQLVVADGEVDEIKDLFATKQNVFRTSLAGALQGTMSTVTPINFSNEPTGVSYNPADGHIFYSDDSKRRIFEVAPGNDGVLGTSDDITTSISVSTFAGRDPEDVSYDALNRRLWIIDGLNAEVYQVQPGANNKFDGVPPDGDDVLTQFDTRSIGIIDPEGIYFDPATGNLILSSSDTTKLYEVSTAGVLLRTFDISAANAVKVAGVTMAPSSTTVGATNFYVVDRMIDNDVNPNENDGRLYEFTSGSLSTATPTATPTNTSTATTVPPTATPTNTATATPVPPTATPTNTPTATAVVPTATATNTPTATAVPPTATATNTPTMTPVPPTATATSTPTAVPSVQNFSPIGDAYVRSDFPNSNYGSSVDVRVVGSPNIISGYFKFSLTGLSGSPQSAKLRLYVTDPSNVGGAVYLVSNDYNNTITPTTPWVESGLKYNNAPPISGTPISTLGSVLTGTWVEFDVKSAINGDGVYSFAITSSSTNSVYYSSMNASANTPVLVVTR